MDELEVKNAIESFTRPSLYTGVKPLFLVAEELVTEQNCGQVVEAVWINLHSDEEFSYISKFAVRGKILLSKYHAPEQRRPFAGRVALTTQENLKNVVLHINATSKIKEFESKRAALFRAIERDFSLLEALYLQNKEIYLFEKKQGEWKEEFFSDFNIDAPFRLRSVQIREESMNLYLINPKTQKMQKYIEHEKFYGYFIGSNAELAGLKLKSESYAQSISSLQKDAKEFMKNIEWLKLSDKRIQDVVQKLPKHPFEEYFAYVKKEDVRRVAVSDDLVEALKKIILKHMPENNTPLGMEYIPIDKLLYLFHMIISREEALEALQKCDVVYEAEGVLLGHSGERKLPPKFLVPISQVAAAYSGFENFMNVCEDFS